MVVTCEIEPRERIGCRYRNADGSGTVDETVSYEYDAGGLRTKLTLPGSLNVVYTYDPRGQLVSLTDWDSQPTQFAYDLAGRLIASERSNRLRSRYQYDAAGRLRLLRHTKDFKMLGHFEYQVDKRGNRMQALECLPHPTTTSDTTIANTVADANTNTDTDTSSTYTSNVPNGFAVRMLSKHGHSNSGRADPRYSP